MDTRVRRGGWLKGILLWPIEPSETEIRGAAEFVGLVLEGQEYAAGCGSVVGTGNTLTDGQFSMISDVASYIQREDIRWEEPPPMTIVWPPSNNRGHVRRSPGSHYRRVVPIGGNEASSDPPVSRQWVTKAAISGVSAIGSNIEHML
jgi:hypothetical protein